MIGVTLVFCDLVRFSENGPDTQKQIIASLNADVTHQLYEHLSVLDPIPDVISLPTGDGVAIAFVEKDRVSWTVTVLRLLVRLMSWGKHSEIGIRIGVHHGTAFLITDINRRPNICGSAINQCQRVMEAAHPNQVLWSEEAYERHVGQNQSRYAGEPFSLARPAFLSPAKIVTKHGHPIDVRIMHLGDDNKHWDATPPIPKEGVWGKVERTRLVVEFLVGLTRTRDPVVIREQAGISSFGILIDRAGWSADEFSQGYYELAKEQRRLMVELSQNQLVTVRVIISPELVQDTPVKKARLQALREWMDEMVDVDRVGWVNARYEGPNRLILDNRISFEGFKLYAASGFDLTRVFLEDPVVRKHIESFDKVFDDAARNDPHVKATVLEQMRRLCQ
jgi:class 3 adenylate cyclase